MRRTSPTRREKRARIPRLPNYPVVYDPPDRGAPLPAPSDLRYEMVKVGEQANGWPIVEARLKPWPTP